MTCSRPQYSVLLLISFGEMQSNDDLINGNSCSFARRSPPPQATGANSNRVMMLMFGTTFWSIAMKTWVEMVDFCVSLYRPFSPTVYFYSPALNYRWPLHHPVTLWGLLGGAWPWAKSVYVCVAHFQKHLNDDNNVSVSAFGLAAVLRDAWYYLCISIMRTHRVTHTHWTLSIKLKAIYVFNNYDV